MVGPGVRSSEAFESDMKTMKQEKINGLLPALRPHLSEPPLAADTVKASQLERPVCVRNAALTTSIPPTLLQARPGNG